MKSLKNNNKISGLYDSVKGAVRNTLYASLLGIPLLGGCYTTNNLESQVKDTGSIRVVVRDGENVSKSPYFILGKDGHEKKAYLYDEEDSLEDIETGKAKPKQEKYSDEHGVIEFEEVEVADEGKYRVGVDVDDDGTLDYMTKCPKVEKDKKSDIEVSGVERRTDKDTLVSITNYPFNPITTDSSVPVQQITTEVEIYNSNYKKECSETAGDSPENNCDIKDREEGDAEDLETKLSVHKSNGTQFVSRDLEKVSPGTTKLFLEEYFTSDLDSEAPCGASGYFTTVSDTEGKELAKSSLIVINKCASDSSGNSDSGNQGGEQYTDSDLDGDGLSNNEEIYTYGTSIYNSDTDGDGISDGQEVANGSNPLDANDPNPRDTDGDGLSDIDEINIYKTNPSLEDTDGDGLTDFQEINNYLTNPLVADTDGDGISDGEEVANGTNPLDVNDPVTQPTKGTIEGRVIAARIVTDTQTPGLFEKVEYAGYPGGAISVLDGQGNLVYSTQSNTDGSFSISLDIGNYDLKFKGVDDCSPVLINQSISAGGIMNLGDLMLGGCSSLLYNIIYGKLFNSDKITPIGNKLIGTGKGGVPLNSDSLGSGIITDNDGNYALYTWGQNLVQILGKNSSGNWSDVIRILSDDSKCLSVPPEVPEPINLDLYLSGETTSSTDIDCN